MIATARPLRGAPAVHDKMCMFWPSKQSGRKLKLGGAVSRNRVSCELAVLGMIATWIGISAKGGDRNADTSSPST
jgi:hypothetical protein